MKLANPRRLAIAPSAPVEIAPEVLPVADDSTLVAGLRRGSPDALVRAFDRWHQRVRVLARRLLADEAAAEDVVQDVFTALPRAIGRFRGESELEAFLLGIAMKCARRLVRAAARRRAALARLAGSGLGDAPGSSVDPERHTYRHQLATRLADALATLPLAQREAFVLCEVEGLTSGQAARIARAPEGTLRTRLYHARRRLRVLLAIEGAE